MKKIIALTSIIMIAGTMAGAQELHLYKQIDTAKLYVEVHSPPSMNRSEQYPAMVFFFGGGWNGGSRNQFRPHAEYFARRGIVCFLADYRIRNRHQTPPFESLKDARSAVRYIRQNAAEFGIDPGKIIASGGSAGGHLAAATALVRAYDDPGDNLSVSCVPNALVLFNPVIDNGPGGYGYERIGMAYHAFSPLHNIQAGAPPTILFLGTEDRLIPVATVEYYQTVMEKVGSRCELKIYEGQGHGFFNYRNIEYYKQTVRAADEFLQSLGYLKENPRIPIE